MKTHYELLSLPSTADADAIKKAFRREIARYHPDKVIHLGAEFQDMAATRAAELTVAYKTLSDPSLREEYDASIEAGVPPPHIPQTPQPEFREQAAPAPEVHEDTPPPPPGTKGRFASERADRDVILTRAIAGRVLGIVETLYGKIHTPTVRGFDLAMVPLAKPRFLGSHPPRTGEGGGHRRCRGDHRGLWRSVACPVAHRKVAGRRAAVRQDHRAATGDLQGE